MILYSHLFLIPLYGIFETDREVNLMLEKDIVKDVHFREVAEVRADSKNRITLGKTPKLGKISSYKVYSNAIGQIILDPQV